MGTLENLQKFNTVRKGVQNLPKNKWGILTTLLAGTKYGGQMGKLLGLYARIRMVFFLLYLALIVFVVLMVIGVIYVAVRLSQ